MLKYYCSSHGWQLLKLKIYTDITHHLSRICLKWTWKIPVTKLTKHLPLPSKSFTNKYTWKIKKTGCWEPVGASIVKGNLRREAQWLESRSVLTSDKGTFSIQSNLKVTCTSIFRRAVRRSNVKLVYLNYWSILYLYNNKTLS